MQPTVFLYQLLGDGSILPVCRCCVCVCVLMGIFKEISVRQQLPDVTVCRFCQQVSKSQRLNLVTSHN